MAECLLCCQLSIRGRHWCIVLTPQPRTLFAAAHCPVSLRLPLCQDQCQDQSCKPTFVKFSQYPEKAHIRALPLLKEPNSAFTFKNLLKIDIMQFSDYEIFANLRLQLYLGWTPRTCGPRSCGGGLTPRSTDTTRTSAQTITRWPGHSNIFHWLLVIKIVIFL